MLLSFLKILLRHLSRSFFDDVVANDVQIDRNAADVSNLRRSLESEQEDEVEHNPLEREYKIEMCEFHEPTIRGILYCQ